MQRGLVGCDSRLLRHCPSSGKGSQGTIYDPRRSIGAVAGLFLLVGLWTPIAGALAFLVQAWAILLGLHEPLITFVSGTLSATIAMIGPGAWSIDARIFGRKHIETRLPPQK